VQKIFGQILFCRGGFGFWQVVLLSNKVNVALAGAEAKNSYIWSVVKHKTGNAEDNCSAI
jgi:hypothetical protein